MVPQVLQLNEMQPCWEERLPHCPRYPPNTHTLGLFSSYPHTVPAPTLLMFIHQPLKGQMQRPVKTKSDLFINDTRPSPLRLREPSLMASWQPCLKKFTLLWTDADHRCDFHRGKHKLYRDSRGREGGLRGHREGEVEKLQEAKGHEKGEGQTENEASLSLLMTDCLPSGLNHDLWLTGRGEGEGGKKGAGRGLRMGAAQNILPYGGLWRRSLMIKNIPGKACFLCTPAMLFVGWD